MEVDVRVLPTAQDGDMLGQTWRSTRRADRGSGGEPARRPGADGRVADGACAKQPVR